MAAVAQIAAGPASSPASRPPSQPATASAATGSPADSVRLHAVVRNSRSGRGSSRSSDTGPLAARTDPVPSRDALAMAAVTVPPRGEEMQRRDLETGVWSRPDRELVQAA